MTDQSWEERMAARAAEREQRRREAAGRPMPAWPDGECRVCWKWVPDGAHWIMQHRGDYADCTHACHDNEVPLGASGSGHTQART